MEHFWTGADYQNSSFKPVARLHQVSHQKTRRRQPLTTGLLNLFQQQSSFTTPDQNAILVRLQYFSGRTLAPLRHLLFAVRETATADDNPEPGRQYLRDTFGQGYWAQRERFVGLLEWLAQLGNAVGMEEWATDS